MSRSIKAKHFSLVELCLIIVAGCALTFALAARTASIPLLKLGPIVVGNGTAAVVGTVGPQAAGQTLTVNGQPLAVDAAGHFDAIVSLNGASALDLTLAGAPGDQHVQFAIPLTAALLGPDGVIPAGVLDSLEQAGLSLAAPVTGRDGGPLTVSGAVADKSQLSSLSVNGQDVLGRLDRDGSFSVQIPGSSKVVSVTATDKQGLSETTSTRLEQQSVSASSAIGLRIAKVRFYTRNAVRKHRVRMVVTVKDRLGRLVRGARISVRPAKVRMLAHRPKATRSGLKGKATVGLRLRSGALGKRLVVVTLANTPKAKARKSSSVRLPRGHAKR